MKILLCPRTSALRDSLGSQRTLHTFANRTSQPTNQICKRVQFLPTLQQSNNLYIKLKRKVL